MYKSNFVNAPIIEEFPMTLECNLIKFNEDGLVVGEIVNVNADESILDENGNIDYKKLEPITYDSVNNLYIKLGDKVGTAFLMERKLNNHNKKKAFFRLFYFLIFSHGNSSLPKCPKQAVSL